MRKVLFMVCFVSVAWGKPFVETFVDFAESQSLPYDVKLWVKQIEHKDFQPAAHLWSSIQLQIPESFRDSADAAFAYLLWKNDLPYTFLENWLSLLNRKSFRESELERRLEEELAQHWDAFFQSSVLFLSPDQRSNVSGLPVSQSKVLKSLKATLLLRSGASASTTLEQLPDESPLRVPLAKTVALALAKQKQLKLALKTLRDNFEGVFQKTGDPKLLTDYQLQAARLHYQQGDLDEADKLYESIPNGAPQYLPAREELIWVHLRKGDTPKLRGDLKSMSFPLFEAKFVPEVYVVRAISNLKLCLFSEVEKDFKVFLKENTVWAKRIEEALKSENPEAPPESDWYLDALQTALASRVQERGHLEEMRRRSIAAALPSVGRQLHWTTAMERLDRNERQLRSMVSLERRRQWKLASHTLKEAIRKMQFVKMEILSQLSQQVAAAPTSEESKANQNKAAALVKEEVSSQWNFPFDGALWPDELFKLRSTASNQCL